MKRLFLAQQQYLISILTNILLQSTFDTKHLLPAWPRCERIPKHRQLGFRRRRSRRRPRSVGCRQRKHNIFGERKPSTDVFFKPGNCHRSAVSSTAPRQNHKLVQPCCKVHIYNRHLFPCTWNLKVNTHLSDMTWRTEGERASELLAEFVQDECQTNFPCRFCLLKILLTSLPSRLAQLRVALIGVIQSRQ
jgi:hypothetical protein